MKREARINLVMSETLRARIDAYCERTGLSLSEVIRRAVTDLLDREETKNK